VRERITERDDHLEGYRDIQIYTIIERGGEKKKERQIR